MEKSRVIAIVFSDLHLNMWAKYNDNNERTLKGFKVLSIVSEVCTKLRVPALFCGDLFHKPENLDSDLALMMKDWLHEIYLKRPSFTMYCINGNHDLKHANRLNPKDPKDFSNLHRGLIDLYERYTGNNSNIKVLSPEKPPIFLGDDCLVYGVPYIDHNVGLTEYLKSLKLRDKYKNVLMLHTDYPGAKDTDNRPVDSVENLNINILKKFDLVLCGHIHKPQRLSKKVYMVGAPCQQRRTDKNCEMGYWELYSDLTMKFIPLKGFPRFIDVETPEEIKDDGNYYTVLPKSNNVEALVKHRITKQLSKKKLAHKYLKARGINDKDKESLLVKVLKQSEDI